MIVNVVSAFRNMTGRIPKYFQQVHALRQAWLEDGRPADIRVIACTGDNVDLTVDDLRYFADEFKIPIVLVILFFGRSVLLGAKDQVSDDGDRKQK